jgi:hypothetical protein
MLRTVNLLVLSSLEVPPTLDVLFDIVRVVSDNRTLVACWPFPFGTFRAILMAVLRVGGC